MRAPSWKAIFLLQKGWPLKKGSTVQQKSVEYIYNSL